MFRSLRTTALVLLLAIIPLGAVDAMDERATAGTAEKSLYVQRMMTLDRNGDGQLSASELPGKLDSLLTTADANQDQQLSPSELAAAENAVRSERSGATGKSEPSAPMRRGGQRGRPATGKGSPLDAEQILRFALTFDDDQDGGLNSEELQRYVAALAVRRAQARRQRGDTAGSEQPESSRGSQEKSAGTKARGLSADGRGDGGFGDE